MQLQSRCLGRHHLTRGVQVIRTNHRVISLSQRELGYTECEKLHILGSTE